MNFGLAFTYQFQDPDWIKKILLNGLLALIPIVGPFYLSGWMLEIAARFAKDDSVLLPEIDFGKYLKKGFMASVVSLIYSLPGFLVTIPAIIMMVVSASGGDETLMTVAMITMICCYGLGFLVMIATSLLSMVAVVEFTLKDFKSALQVKHMFAIFKSAIGPYLLTILVVGLAVPIIASLGSIACGIGVLFTMPYSLTVTAALLGQAYRQGAGAQSLEI